ncbi:MAG: HD domain-containing protein [Lachnospiraceae bacterium]|nr:HD domain-containing protein [Lachnospiraceae bacterium]
MPSIKEQFDEYTDRMAEIRRLSSPDINVFDDANDYSKKLRYNFQRIGRLAALNRDMLDKTLYPVVNSKDVLESETVKQMRNLADSLLNIADAENEFENLDLPISYLISERLLFDAKNKNSVSEMIRQLEREIAICYSMMNMTNRIATHPQIPEFYRKRGIAIGEEFFKLLAKDRFLTIKDQECREIVLTNARFIPAFNERVVDDKEANKKDLEILDWMLEIAEDDFYKKAVPGFDWRYFKFRVLEYYMQNTEMNNYRGFSDEQLKAICKKADEMNYVCQNTPDYYREIIGYSTLPILIARCRYLGGEIDKKLYLEMLMQSYKKRDKLTFSTDGCFYNMLVPLEIICQMNPYELNMEEVSLLEEIYDNLCAYIFRFAGDSALSFELENVSEIIRRYIEVPSGVLFKDFVLQIIAAIHPPTYIHSQMVGQLTECFCYHLINKNPEIFVGMPGIENVDDVYKKRSHIVDYAYNAALCHDFGKAFIMDTIFVYGRRLLDFEFDIIKAHPEVGYMLLSNNESTREYADVARGHHKWYDDTKGYPENVKTVDSPYKVIIDIVQCADCMDAATDSVGRSYNQGKTLANFIKEIKADSGSRYAPFLAPLFDDPMVYQDVEYLLDEQRAKNYERTYSLLREVKDKG